MKRMAIMKYMLRTIAAASLALAACTSSGPSGVVNRYRGSEGQTEITKVRNNPQLDAALKMEKLLTTRQNGVLVVQFELVNTRQGPVGFQWTADWWDRQGVLIDYTAQHWAAERLAAGSSKTIKLVAPSPEATSFQLQIGSRDEVQ
jgi:uncharacterized protein YcfL